MSRPTAIPEDQASSALATNRDRHAARRRAAPEPRGTAPADPLSVFATPRRLALRFAAFVALLVLVALAIRGLPGLDDVRRRLGAGSARGIVLVAGLELGSVLGFVVALRGAFSSIPPWRISLALGTAEQGANVLLPAGGVGGLALGAVFARDAGVPSEIAVSRTVALFLVTSAVTFVGIAVGGALAAVGRGDVPWYGSVAPAALAAVALATVSALPSVLKPGSRGLRRRLSASARSGITSALRLVCEPNLVLLSGAVAYFAFDVGALAAGFHALGAESLPVGAFLLAYTLGQAGGMLPLPGGVGGVDGGLIGMFVLYGTSVGDATAAVLAYRLFQLGVPVVCGLVGFLVLTHERRTSRDVPAVAASFAHLRTDRG